MYRVLTRILAAAVGVAVAVGILFLLGEKGYYDLPFALRLLPIIRQGFYLSLEIIAVVIPGGFALGFIIGWARTTRFAVLRGVGALYVDFFRSMPPIALIAFASILGFVALHPFFLNDPLVLQKLVLWLGVLAVALHTAAYQAEIVRAGILSVPAAQTEAADAIGMSRIRSMFRVILPQAFRVSLPALGNEFSSVIKDTSLLSVIGWFELSGLGTVLASNALLTVSPFAPIIVWVEIAIFYFVATFSVNKVVRAVEDGFRVPGLEAARL